MATVVSCPGALVSVEDVPGSYSATCSQPWETVEIGFLGLPPLTTTEGAELALAIMMLMVVGFVWRQLRRVC